MRRTNLNARLPGAKPIFRGRPRTVNTDLYTNTAERLNYQTSHGFRRPWQLPGVAGLATKSEPKPLAPSHQKRTTPIQPTPGSPSKFLLAAFVRIFAQKVTAEICPVQPFVMFSWHTFRIREAPDPKSYLPIR